MFIFRGLRVVFASLLVAVLFCVVYATVLVEIASQLSPIAGFELILLGILVGAPLMWVVLARVVRHR